MKYLLLVVTLTMSFNVDASIEDDLTNICNIVKVNDKTEFRKKERKIKDEYSLRLNDYYNGIKCGGKSLVQVASENNAVDVGELIVKRLTKEQAKHEITLVSGDSVLYTVLSERSN